MRKKIIILAVISFNFIYYSDTYAVPMNSTVINYTHTTTNTTFTTLCKNKIKGATDAICNCVGETVESSIDDNALNKCDADDNMCISNVVKAAGLKAFTPDSITACVKKVESKNKQGN